jgi:PRTRC genetic system protein C
MTALRADALVREFYYNGIRIPDPGPDLTVEQVRDLL